MSSYQQSVVSIAHPPLIPGLLFGFLVFLTLILVSDLREASGGSISAGRCCPPSWETLSIAVFVLAFSTGVGGSRTQRWGSLDQRDVELLLGPESGTAAAATLLIRFATLWFGVGLGLIVWAFSRKMQGVGHGELDDRE